MNADTLGTSIEIAVHVPISNIFGYLYNLRSMTNGRAHFEMKFDHYVKVPSGGPDNDPPGEIAKRA